MSPTLYTNLYIDTIQNTKTFWINKMIHEESIKKPLHDFITAQTIFTKEAFKTTIEYIEALTKNITK